MIDYLQKNKKREHHQRFFRVNQQRRVLLPKSIMLGLFTGSMSGAFRLCLDFSENFRNQLIEQAHQYGCMGATLVVVFSTVFITVATLVVLYFAPEAAGSGIPHVKAVLLNNQIFRWFRVLIVKFISGIMGISSGLMLGREGPTVQMGAAIGKGLATLPHSRQYEHQVLIAAGGGAGLSAAFNSPLSGLVFVLEELKGNFVSLEFFAAASACLTADMVSRVVFGQLPIFHITLLKTPDLILLLVFIPLGILAGILGVIFNKCILTAHKISKNSTKFKIILGLLCGIVLSWIGWTMPYLLGGGQKIIDKLLDNEIAISAMPIFFCIRFLLTISSYSTGVAGGIFTPILVMGALLGISFEHFVQLLFPQLHMEMHTFAVVGMASYFTGIVRAPLTGIVLMIEMTGNYELILPLFVACFTSLIIADALNDLPIYEALLESD